MKASSTPGIHDGQSTPLVPPQLPPFMTNVFDLKPIVGQPGREQVKLVHEAMRALNNFLHSKYMPKIRDTDLPMELSQHLFDVQMACHRQKFPVNIFPSDVIYDPPTLPSYIPVELKSITGPPSTKEIVSVQGALHISEGFVGAPSIFDPDIHAELSQHLFDIQLARYVQRSMVNQSTAIPSVPKSLVPGGNDDNDASRHSGDHQPTSLNIIGLTESQHPTTEHPNHPDEAASSEVGNLRRTNELMVELRDTMKNMNRVLIGTQNSLALGFNSSSRRTSHSTVLYDLGAHSLINDNGEVPEAYNLPTFKNEGRTVSFPLKDLTENLLAQYLRFYGIGEEMIEEGKELKIKSGMIEDAKVLLSQRLFLNRR